MIYSLPSLLSYSYDNIYNKISYLKDISLKNIIINNPKILMQSVALTYARYEYLKSIGIDIDEDNCRKIFMDNTKFERQFKISKQQLLNDYNYDQQRVKTI